MAALLDEILVLPLSRWSEFRVHQPVMSALCGLSGIRQPYFVLKDCDVFVTGIGSDGAGTSGGEW